MFLEKHSVLVNAHGLQRRVVFCRQYNNALVERVAKTCFVYGYLPYRKEAIAIRFEFLVDAS